MRILALCLLASTFGAVAQGPVSPAQPSWLDVTHTPQQRAHDLVARMTLEEKAHQSVNNAPGIARLGVPAYNYWNEGLHGIARTGYSTLFPQAIGMAATWDAELLGRIGAAVSTEARAKYNEALRTGSNPVYYGLTIWAPNINIFRDPRWGRGQETYGEDPYLTATLADQFVRGVQGDDPRYYRGIATPKHFAAHSGPESERHRLNVEPSPHDLWDTYLPAFRKTIVESQAGSLMCAYNAIDGTPACASDLLLKTILRSGWHFNGFVTSDCGGIDDFYKPEGHATSPDATHAAATAVLAGTDTNCGSTYLVLPQAVQQGLLREADLDRAIERLFEARIRLGLFDPPSVVPYASISFTELRSAEHQALALKASEESIVLLKNDGILPLRVSRYKTIAVIGPNAASLESLEGNYNAIPKDPQMPVDSIRAAFPGARIVYAQGAPLVDGVRLPVSSTMLRTSLDGGQSGLIGEYFNADPAQPAASFSAEPLATRIDQQIEFNWNGAAPVDQIKPDAFAIRWRGFIVPPAQDELDFNIRLAHCAPCERQEGIVIKIDGTPVETFGTLASKGQKSSRSFKVKFTDTKPHAIEIEYAHVAPFFGAGLTLEWMPPAGVLQAAAIQAAQNADLIIAMIGISPELEGEQMKLKVAGFSDGDRTDIQLPASQDVLLDKLVATGKPLVAVLMNGSALAAPFAEDHANAILEAWYPGEFGGKAIAETLLGRNNPSGRLPVTFYRSVTDLPPFTDYSMRNRTYRYFTGTPLYSFGFGLSYTHFAYTHLLLSTATLRAGESLTATVEVSNIGLLAGDEVAEAYLMPPPTGNGGISPRLQLAAFKRIALQPGERRTVTFTIDPRGLSEVDSLGARSVQPGAYLLTVGSTQPDDPRAPMPSQRATFQIHGSLLLPQ